MENDVINVNRGPGCLLQIVWFLFVGIWLGQIWISIAWILMVTIIGIPLGIMMLNILPQVMLLRDNSTYLHLSTTENGTTVTRVFSVPQHNIIIRAIYFVFIGWWLSALWIQIAYLLCISIIGLPFAFIMFDNVPAIVSLRR